MENNSKSFEVTADTYKRKEVIDTANSIFESSQLPYSVVEKEYGCTSLQYNGKEICNALFIPTLQKHYVKLDNKNFKISLDVLTSKEILGPIEVDTNQLDSKNWIYEHLGCTKEIYYTPSNLEYIKESIIILCSAAEEEIIYHYSGFKPDCSAYIFNSELITANNHSLDNEYEKRCCQFIFDDLLQVGSFTNCLKMFLVLLISLCISLLKNHGSFVPQMCLYLMGPSGSRKTSISKVFFCINDHQKTHIHFDSTYAATDYTLKNYRDQPVVFDDLHPPSSKSEYKEFQKKLELILRSSGDSGSKRQKVRGTSIMDESIEIIPIITAEFLATNVRSSQARLLPIKLEKDEIHLDKLTIVQENISLLDDFIKSYIGHILSKKDFIDKFVESFTKTRDSFIKDKKYAEAHGRTIEIASWLIAANQMFLEYAMMLNIIDLTTANQQKKALEKDMGDYIKSQTLLLATQSQLDMFFEAIADMLVKDEVNLVPIYSKNGKNDVSQKTIGFLDNSEIFLRNRIVYEKVRRYYLEKEIYEYTASDKEIRQQMKTRLLFHPNQKHQTETKQFFGTREQVTRVFRNQFNNEIDKRLAKEDI